jgi:hypothetical protein
VIVQDVGARTRIEAAKIERPVRAFYERAGDQAARSTRSQTTTLTPSWMRSIDAVHRPFTQLPSAQQENPRDPRYSQASARVG